MAIEFFYTCERDKQQRGTRVEAVPRILSFGGQDSRALDLCDSCWHKTPVAEVADLWHEFGRTLTDDELAKLRKTSPGAKKRRRIVLPDPDPNDPGMTAGSVTEPGEDGLFHCPHKTKGKQCPRDFKTASALGAHRRHHGWAPSIAA